MEKVNFHSMLVWAQIASQLVSPVLQRSGCLKISKGAMVVMKGKRLSNNLYVLEGADVQVVGDSMASTTAVCTHSSNAKWSTSDFDYLYNLACETRSYE